MNLFESVIEMFRSLTPINWVGQILGLIGLIIILVSLFFKKRAYLIISGVAFLFFVAEQVIGQIYSNAIATCIALARNIIMIYYLDKKNTEVPGKVYIGLIAALWIVTLVGMILSDQVTSLLEYIPLVTTTIFSIFINHKNYLVVKIAIIYNEVSFGVYYFLEALPFSLLRQIITSGVAVISLIIYIIVTIKEKKKSLTTDSQSE